MPPGTVLLHCAARSMTGPQNIPNPVKDVIIIKAFPYIDRVSEGQMSPKPTLYRSERSREEGEYEYQNAKRSSSLSRVGKRT
jgi:hypothetical protein